MLKKQTIHKTGDIEFNVIYSHRRTIGISVRPDSSVTVRAPYLTSLNAINRIIREKYKWVEKHRDNYRNLAYSTLNKTYTSGEKHLFRGNESVLRIQQSKKTYFRFYDNTIELGISKTDNAHIIKRLLYAGYKSEALVLLPILMSKVLSEHENQKFRPTGLVIRTMKRRWGSCSIKGVITLSTELIKLADLYIEYVIIHELCHLKHHNHGPLYYKLLSEVFPEWKTVRKVLKQYIQ